MEKMIDYINTAQSKLLTLHCYICILSLLFIGCKPHKEPIDSAQIQKNPIEEIRIKFNLTNIEFQKVKKSDSIVQELKKVLVIKDSLKLYHINRRLDSFFLKKYNQKELVHMLKLERLMRTKSNNFELNRNLNPNSSLHFKSIEDFKRFEDTFSIKVKVIKDTIRGNKF